MIYETANKTLKVDPSTKLLYLGNSRRVNAIQKDSYLHGINSKEITVYPYIKLTKVDDEVVKVTNGMGERLADHKYQPVLLSAKNFLNESASQLGSLSENVFYAGGMDPALEYLVLKIMEHDKNPSKFWGYDLARIRQLLITGELKITIENSPKDKEVKYLFIDYKLRSTKDSKKSLVQDETPHNPAETPLLLKRFDNLLKKGESINFSSEDLNQIIIDTYKSGLRVSIVGIDYLSRLKVFTPSKYAEEIITQEKRSLFMREKRDLLLGLSIKEVLNSAKNLKNNIASGAERLNEIRSNLIGIETEDEDEIIDNEDSLPDKPEDIIHI